MTEAVHFRCAFADALYARCLLLVACPRFIFPVCFLRRTSLPTSWLRPVDAREERKTRRKEDRAARGEHNFRYTDNRTILAACLQLGEGRKRRTEKEKEASVPAARCDCVCSLRPAVCSLRFAGTTTSCKQSWFRILPPTSKGIRSTKSSRARSAETRERQRGKGWEKSNSVALQG